MMLAIFLATCALDVRAVQRLTLRGIFQPMPGWLNFHEQNGAA